jgi:hypothetical protein
VLDDVEDVDPARSDARHGRNVIGLERVLHAEQKPHSQDTDHDRPAR